MLPSRYSPRTLFVHLRPDVFGQVLPHIGADGLGRERDSRDRPGVLRDERALSRVPGVEQLLGGCGADQAWVRDPGEAHAGDVPRGGVDPVEVPDRFGSAGLELLSCVS